MALQGEPEGPTGSGVVVSSPEDLALSLSGGRRAEGAKPVGVRAHPLLPPQAGGDQPVRPARRRPRSPCSPTRSHRTATTSSTCSTPRRPRRSRASTVRHRPARPRLPEPRHLRHAHVALGRALRRVPLDDDRDDDRSDRRLLRRRRRQPADALHRPDPDAARARRAADGSSPSSARRSPFKVAIILALLFWTGIARDRARRLPLAAGEGVRRGGQGERRERPAHHRAAHAPEHARPDHRQHHAHRSPPPSSSRPRSRSSASASSRRTPRSAR